MVEQYKPNVVWHWATGGFEEERPCAISHDLHPELCVLLSTSGSTGTPKFVKLSATNIDSNARSICEYLREWALSERAATTLQFNYSYGMSVVNSHLACGASLALTGSVCRGSLVLELFRRVRGDQFAGVPYSFEMLDRAAFPWAATPGLRYATQAGGRLAPELVRRIARSGNKYGWRFYVMYGQTRLRPGSPICRPSALLNFRN